MGMVFKSKLKWVALVGLALSVVSLFAHFVLAVYSGRSADEYQASVTIFSLKLSSGSADQAATVSIRRRLWGPVKHLALLHPSANPRDKYNARSSSTNGFIFVKIQGGFHEIRNSICDVVAVSRLLNAALVIPELQSTTSSKGISSDFKSFEYLYNENQFIAALAKDVVVVRSLPNKFKIARRRKEIPVFKVPHSTAPDFYLEVVLPVLKRHSVVELLVNDGGCLQAILPPNLVEYQRLRCRVAFHALRFRQDVQDLASKIHYRLKASNRPYIAYDPGLTRDALAYFGCAELFQDVHAEIIQHRRRWMIRRGLVKGGLSVDSAKQRLNGSCPLMPEEVGILLRAFGYSSDTIIYVAGGEIFGGQRLLIPLRAMFDNVVDRTFLSTSVELRSIYGREKYISDLNTQKVQATIETKVDKWKTSGPRPRPLPPPPARPKYPYNLEGWWGWVAEVDKEPVPTISEMRTNAHKLLWEAIDYVISVEADVFIPGFDLDGKGHPNFAGSVMGHRMYQSAASKTFRPDRKVVASFLEEIHDHLYQANRTLVTSLRRHLTKTLLEGLLESSKRSKSLSFLAHPIPECSCLRHEAGEVSSQSKSPSPLNNIVPIETHYKCPAWMDNDTLRFVDKETFDELEDNNSYSEQFFEQNVYNQDVRGPESGSKEDVQIDDQDDLEGAEK